MEYRALGATGMQVSRVGFGGEHLEGMEYRDVEAVVHAALDAGINMMDCFMAEPHVRSNIGKALGRRRPEMQIQGHIGACWLGGQYKRSRDLDQCKAAFSDLLTRMDTDYLDVGMIHYVDTQEDLSRMLENGILDYAQELKQKGMIRAIGVSSHDPGVALSLVETGVIEVLMFSINAAYDLLDAGVSVDDLIKADLVREGKDLHGIHPARQRLYEACEARGVGITVMKPFGAGKLLKEELSPFGAPMTPIQCIHYCLTRPGVASVLAGYRSPAEVEAAVAYESATPEERDYSPFLGATQLYSMAGNCMYCNHCLPCPARIDVAQVNKYLDLALVAEGKVPDTVREHYLAMETHGEDCIACRSCESNCPFGVLVVERMKKAKEVFGR